MLGEVPIGGVEVRFVKTGVGDGVPKIVRDQDLGDALKKFKGMHMGLNPRGEVLGEGGLRKGVITGSQSSYKDLGLVDLPGLMICDLHRLPSIVDEELFSGPIILAKTGIQLLGPLTVETAELAVLVPFRIPLLIFMPEKLKRHPFLLQLLMKILRGRHLTLFLRNSMETRKEPMFQGSFVQFRRKRPTESCPLGSVKVISNRTPANIKTLGNLSG